MQPVDSLGRRRQLFARPVRRQRHERGIGNCGEALPPPPGEIGHDNVITQVDFGLVENPPPARSSATLAEGTADLNAQHRSGVCVS
jgi:hypothetical protein